MPFPGFPGEARPTVCSPPHSLACIQDGECPCLSIMTMAAVATFLLFSDRRPAPRLYQELVSFTVIAAFLLFIYIFGSGWKAGGSTRTHWRWEQPR